jgi:hypothetical protein
MGLSLPEQSAAEKRPQKERAHPPKRPILIIGRTAHKFNLYQGAVMDLKLKKTLVSGLQILYDGIEQIRRTYVQNT